jgi:hypothetical protein
MLLFRPKASPFFERERCDGVVTRTLARIRLSGKMAHDDHVCPPPVSPAIIRHAVWLYVRFALSYRDVEDLLAERGLDISYETDGY